MKHVVRSKLVEKRVFVGRRYGAATPHCTLHRRHCVEGRRTLPGQRAGYVREKSRLRRIGGEEASVADWHDGDEGRRRAWPRRRCPAGVDDVAAAQATALLSAAAF